MTDCPTPKDLDQSKKGWYLDLMAPNTLGPKYSWVDPTRIYLFPKALKDCVDDLVAPFKPEEVDLVAGIVGPGFIIGMSVANRLGKGFLAFRKAGELCVDTESKSYIDHQKIEKCLEIRKNPFTEGTRVLLVDQWIETGGTMEAACLLIKSQGGIVAGMACICIEESEGGKTLCHKYKYSHCTPPELQDQLNKHELESFKLFK